MISTCHIRVMNLSIIFILCIPTNLLEENLKVICDNFSFLFYLIFLREDFFSFLHCGDMRFAKQDSSAFLEECLYPSIHWTLHWRSSEMIFEKNTNIEKLKHVKINQ